MNSIVSSVNWWKYTLFLNASSLQLLKLNLYINLILTYIVILLNHCICTLSGEAMLPAARVNCFLTSCKQCASRCIYNHLGVANSCHIILARQFSEDFCSLQLVPYKDMVKKCSKWQTFNAQWKVNRSCL